MSLNNAVATKNTTICRRFPCEILPVFGDCCGLPPPLRLGLVALSTASSSFESGHPTGRRTLRGFVRASHRHGVNDETITKKKRPVVLLISFGEKGHSSAAVQPKTLHRSQPEPLTTLTTASTQLQACVSKDETTIRDPLLRQNQRKNPSSVVCLAVSERRRRRGH